VPLREVYGYAQHVGGILRRPFFCGDSVVTRASRELRDHLGSQRAWEAQCPLLARLQ
jgi:hypothetical protein